MIIERRVLSIIFIAPVDNAESGESSRTCTISASAMSCGQMRRASTFSRVAVSIQKHS
jgi:hypothetical protein